MSCGDSGIGRQTVSVVIPSFKRIERLEPLIDAYVLNGAEQVVVVLDGPHEGASQLREVFRDRPVQIWELERNVGLALARIEGLKRATGDIVLLVDDDVLPRSNTVAQHRAAHKNHPSLVVVGYMPVKLPEVRRRDMAATYLYAREYDKEAATWRNNPERILDGLWNGNVSIRRTRYIEAEEYKPSVRLDYNEDLDLGLRLKAMGSDAVFRPEIIADHLHSRNFRGFISESKARGEGAALVQERWGQIPAQLADLVEPDRPHIRMTVCLLSVIPAKVLERAAAAANYVLGLAHAWTLQEATCRLTRRVIARRAYITARKKRSRG